MLQKKVRLPSDSLIKSPLKLFFSLILPFIVQAIGSFVTNPAMSEWYNSLNKPAINPPSWVFAPVWVTLYAMMGLSLYLVWSSEIKSKIKTFAMRLFVVHLALNALWSIVFFDWLNISLALAVITTLWLLILIIILLFFGISKRASILLVPYFLWVSFATYLNFLFWQLN